MQFQAMGLLPKMMGNKNLWLPGRELGCSKSCIPGKNSPDALWTKGLRSDPLGTWADGTPWVQSQRGGSMARCLVFAPIVSSPVLHGCNAQKLASSKSREHIQMHVLSVLISVLGYTIQRSTEACVSSCKPLDEGRHAATRVGKSSTAVVHL